MKLKFSIITVCYNAQSTIEKTIQSVISQTYDNIEFIIIDGKSTDKTLDIINKYKEKIHVIISEKDKGIYDAMNKGIKNSTGDILYFLNADDRLYTTKTIDKINSVFIDNPQYEIIYGKAAFVNIPKDFPKRFINRKFGYNSKLDLLIQSNPQQCIFAKKQVFDKVGIFNTNYKICSDYDWFLRCFNKKIPMKYKDIIIVNYNCQGLSFHIKDNVILEKLKVAFINSNIFEFAYYICYAIIRQFIRQMQFFKINKRFTKNV